MGTLTINTTALQDARLIIAFGNRLQTRDASNVRRDATGAEIKADIIRYITSVVLDDEQSVSAKSAIAGIVPIVPT